MFDLINGLPIHPLVVHAVVVLVPLAALGTIAIAVRPAWRAKYGVPVVVTAVLGAILCPVATSSGEALEKHVGSPGDHAEMGDQLVWFVIALALMALGLVLLDRRRSRTPDPNASSSAPASTTALRVVATLAVVAALATSVQVYRVGDSGARAAWGDQVASSSTGGDGD